MADKIDKLLKKVNNLEVQLVQIKNEINSITSVKKDDDKKIKEEIVNKPESKPKKDYEFSIGGYIIGIIGAVAVLIACGWFIKLAIDKRWLNESARIILGIILGFLLIIASWFLAKKKFKVLPDIVFGLGYAVLYIILFSAYNFYELLNITETFVYLFALSIVSTFIANISRSQILYIISLAGAFLAPLIVSQGENSYRFLFSYLTVLNLIFIFISKKFNWKTCAYILLGSNILLYFIWAVNNIEKSSFLIPFLFISILFLIIMLRNFFLIQKNQKSHIADLILIILNVLCYVSAGHLTLNFFYEKWIPHFYILTSFAIIIWNYFYQKLISSPEEKINLNVFVLFSFIPLCFIGGGYFFEGPWILSIFISSAGILSIIGSYLKKYAYIIASLPLWIISIISVWAYNIYGTDIALIFNSRFYLYIVCFILLGITFLFQTKNKILWAFGYASLIMIIIGSLFENHEIFIDSIHFRRLSYSYIILFYALAVLLPGFILSKKVLRYTGLGLIGIVILKFYLYDIWVFNTNVRIIAGFTLGGILIILAIFYQKLKARITKNA